jgi:hypothetical protein
MSGIKHWSHANSFVRKTGESLSWKVGERIRATPRRRHFLLDFPNGSVCAEIGVFQGEFTRHILEVTEPRELHLIDGWWDLYGEVFPDWGAYTEFGHLGTHQAYDDAQDVVARVVSPSTKVETHVGDDCEILETFADGYFDWVYLDASHQYEDTVKELEVLSRKVKCDGIIAGDDWMDDPNDVNGGAGVAIFEFCLANNWIVDRRDNFNQWRISKR